MEKRLNRAERRLNAYYRITSNPTLSLDDKIRKLLRFARGSFRMPIAVLARITEQRFEVIHAVPRAGAIPAGTVLNLAHTYCAETVESEHPVGFSNVSGTHRERSECFQRCGLAAYLGMRVIVAGRPWGTLATLSEAARQAEFDEGDLHFIRLLADWIGNALTWDAETRELRALAEWRKAVFSGISSGIVTCDADGTLRELNPAAEAMFGYDEAELAGRYTPKLLIDDGPAHALFRARRQNPANGATLLAFQRATETTRPAPVKAICRRKDGARFPANIAVSTLFDTHGNVQAFVLLIEDVTERLARESAERRIQATELANTILRGFGDGIIGVDSRPPYRIRLLNLVGESLLALPERQALDRPLESCVDIYTGEGEGRTNISEWIDQKEKTLSHLEAVVHVRGNPPFPAAISLTRIHTNHAPTPDSESELTVLTIRNISHRKQAEERLRLSDKVFENSAEAIVITDANGTILSVNPAFSWITGYSPDEAVGQTPSILKSGRHDNSFYTDMWHALLQNGHWEGEIWDRHKAGHLYPKWLTINAVREGGRVTHFVALFSDISARKEQEERIRFLAEHDQLTGLPNRHFLKQHFGLLKISERRRDRSIALMMIDLDEFKQVNDTLGHAAGDELLVEVARRLVASVRESDIVVRLGGDEFVVLLEDVGDHAHLDAIARKMHDAVSQPVTIHGQAITTSPSIGIAVSPNDGQDVEALLRKADIAMYRVKVAGRNNWQFFEQTE